MKILLATAFLMLVISTPFGATAASAATVPELTTCSLRTFKGTVAGAGTTEGLDRSTSFFLALDGILGRCWQRQVDRDG